MLPQIKAMIPKIDSLINSMNTLVSDPHIVHILEQTEQLTTRLNTTTLAMNRLLVQEMPQLMHSLQSTGNNLNEITTELKGIDYIETMELVSGTLENLLTLSETLNSDSGTVGRLLNDTAFYNRLDGVCTHAEQLLKDIKEHPSRYINVSVFGKK
jgi:phospholipid/cholesterol/gamma-HCH transport system substrate-binding protein